MATISAMLALFASCALLGAVLPSLRGRRVRVCIALGAVIASAVTYGALVLGGN